MSNAADREVWLNFLDEVDEYLNTIESVLIGLAETGVDPQGMDAALRAAHTIKGIGSMIECPSLSHLAHRFEDALKIVKARRDSIQVDTNLEMLLLQGSDGMRQISAQHRQALPIEEVWLASHAYPIFEKLQDRLGEIQPSDELALLSEESDSDTAVVMFETEVEELLERLTAVLADPALPCLQEELEMMVEELQDLGRMLQLDAFINLCVSVEQAIANASPSQIETIARQALELWERSQALVMVGKLDKLPTQLEPIADHVDELEIVGSLPIDPPVSLADLSLAEPSSIFEPAVAASEALSLEAGAEEAVIDAASMDSELQTSNITDVFEALPTPGPEAVNEKASSASLSDPERLTDSWEVPPTTADLPELADPPVGEPASNIHAHPIGDVKFENLDFDSIQAAIENFDPEEFSFAAASHPPDAASSTASSQPIELTESEAAHQATSSEPQFEFSLSPQPQAVSEEPVEVLVEPSELPPSTKAQDLQESTVRVPIKLLTQLNDLFGELIIQRNTMNSRLDQMDDLITLFSQRMISLESSNTQLQTFCNQIAVETSAPALRSRNGDTPSGTDPAQASFDFADSQREFDSLELDRYSDLHLLSQEQRETLVQLREVSSDVKLNLRDIKQASGNLNRTAKALQNNVTRARMRPLADIVERFPRTVRDLSLQYGKTVDLQIYGGATLIDRFVAVYLRDPLMHLLRNAFDHGIEDAATRQARGKSSQGTIAIRAAHRGNQTLISMSDDGAGINLNKIRERAYQMGATEELLDNMSEAELLGMIFEPGFSTADQVTDLSGRGIGMDVVRTNLEQIRSEIKVDTQPGTGTTFTISVPFTLSIMRVLLVESGSMRLAFPTDGIEEMIRLKTVQVFDSPEQKVINWEGLTVPLIHLDQWLEFRCLLRSNTTDSTPIINEPSILIVRRGNQLTGIYIDRFWGEREVVIRQVENVISLPPGFNGCTILEDGNVVPLADAAKLLEWIDKDTDEPSNGQRLQHLLQSQIVVEEPEPQQLALPQAQQTSILVIDDSVNMRQLLRTTLEQSGYTVEQAKDGQDAVDQLTHGLPVQAVICDIEMPRLDGYGVLAELKADKAFKDLPIIMLTSRGSEKHRQLAMRLGAAAYITKPYQDHELLQMLAQVLQQQPLSTVG